MGCGESSVPARECKYSAAERPSDPTGSRVDAFGEWCRCTFEGMNRQVDERVVLLVGQTGQGKSSFLNLLFNFHMFIRHSKVAMAGKIQNALDLRFEACVKKEMQSETSAEKHEMQSRTNKATPYKLAIGDLRLCIVDTPGFGDTRGLEIDQKHAQMIVEQIKELKVVHAITLVISGRESRMTAQLKYVLTEICAILPKSARTNIVVVFTNTSGPTFLTFSIDEVNRLVEHQVAIERQIYIENPYVLWERAAQNRGKVDDADLHEDLLHEIAAAEKNLAKFFKEVAQMPRLNTKEFEDLYNMRKAIEATLMETLSELTKAQEQRKLLAKEMEKVQRYEHEQEMHKDFMKTFKCKRWVFKDAARHGTFCGYAGCHSNCHAPCQLEKTMENERFRMCSAFCRKKQEIRLASDSDRQALLQYVKDSKDEPFFENQDGGPGIKKVTVLKAPKEFCFKGKTFIEGALIQDGCRFLAKEGLQELCLPTTVTVEDESDQDTCKKCGHHRSYHYHDEKMCVEEEYTAQTVDEETKRKYEQAKGFHERQQELVKGIEQRLQECGRKQEALCCKLVENVRKFEQVGLSRNYCLLLENQRAILELYIKWTVESDPGADVKAMKAAHEQIEKQLQLTRSSLAGEKGRHPVDWALAMMGLGKVVKLAEVEKRYNEEALRHHPAHGNEDEERMKQLNEALRILRAHLRSKAWDPSTWIASSSSSH